LPNFFIKRYQILGNKVEIGDELLRHLRDSLRIRVGEKVFFVDEMRHRYTVVVTGIGKDLLTGDIIDEVSGEKVEGIHIHIVQAIPKGPKLDFIVQKSTELGVDRITPVFSERSIVRLEKERMEVKLERWRRIALEAAQQSDRWDVPEILPPLSLSEFLTTFTKGDLNLLLWEGEKVRGIRDVLSKHRDAKSAVILVGPEGGFSDREVEMAVVTGFTPVTLGGLILRTETAPLVILSILRYEFGYMGY